MAGEASVLDVVVAGRAAAAAVGAPAGVAGNRWAAWKIFVALETARRLVALEGSELGEGTVVVGRFD